VICFCPLCFYASPRPYHIHTKFNLGINFENGRGEIKIADNLVDEEEKKRSENKGHK